MKKGLIERKKQYYSMIQTYLMRKAKLTNELSKCFPGRLMLKRLPKKKADTLKKYNYKIDCWRWLIKKIDIKLSKLSTLERAVNSFTGVRLSTIKGNSYRLIGTHGWMAKAIYYKYGLEHGLRNTELRMYIGMGKRQSQYEPNRYRTTFTRSFADTPKNREIWVSFKKFYENEFVKSEQSNKRSYSCIPKNKKAA